MYFMINQVKEEWNEAGFPYVDYVIKPSTTFIHIMSDKDEPTNYHGHIDIYVYSDGSFTACCKGHNGIDEPVNFTPEMSEALCDTILYLKYY